MHRGLYAAGGHANTERVNTVVVLREFSTRVEAEIVKELLVSNGIDALVVSDDCGAVDPALQLGRGVRVLVRATDAREAHLLLAAVPTDVEEEETAHDQGSAPAIISSQYLGIVLTK